MGKIEHIHVKYNIYKSFYPLQYFSQIQIYVCLFVYEFLSQQFKAYRLVYLFLLNS